MLSTPRRRIAVLCSGRAPGLVHLLQRAKDPRCAWRVVCCLTSEDSFECQDEVARHRVPILYHPIQRFYAERAPGARIGNREVRRDFDARTVALLNEHRPDMVMLAGYLWLLTEPMLATFAGRLINVHHADLLLRTPSGGPRYPGLRAVRDAILAGERETRCTAHLVTERLDEGPILARSEAFGVPEVAGWARLHGEDDVLRRVIWSHQEWMLRAAFGPLMERAIERRAAQEYAA
jgi:folate-dependent phosphoribosylglycinamide formyltransferase PurN